MKKKRRSIWGQGNELLMDLVVLEYKYLDAFSNDDVDEAFQVFLARVKEIVKDVQENHLDDESDDSEELIRKLFKGASSDESETPPKAEA